MTGESDAKKKTEKQPFISSGTLCAASPFIAIPKIDTATFPARMIQNKGVRLDSFNGRIPSANIPIAVKMPEIRHHFFNVRNPSTSGPNKNLKIPINKMAVASPAMFDMETPILPNRNASVIVTYPPVMPKGSIRNMYTMGWECFFSGK